MPNSSFTRWLNYGGTPSSIWDTVTPANVQTPPPPPPQPISAEEMEEVRRLMSRASSTARRNASIQPVARPATAFNQEEFGARVEVPEEEDDLQSSYGLPVHYGIQGGVSGNVQQGGQEMTTVAQVFGQRATYPSLELHPLIVGRNLAGVEIELENIRGSRRFNYWTQKGDGSLRNNGAEFVCSNPWGGVDLYNAAIEIDGYLFDNNPDTTWRCSTHVHIDVRDMSVEQVKKMILAYAFYERILFKCSGMHRYKNNFCVALGFAQEQVNILAQYWDKPDVEFLNGLVQNWDKYSSINLLPMCNFGSIEFRISEAKWRKGKLIRLVNRFLSLKEIAMNNDLNERAFIEMLYSTPIKQIIQKGLPKGLDNLEEDLDFGYKLANDIINLAAIRRKSIKEFVPDVNDGTRVVQNCVVNQDGWNHCRGILQRRFGDRYEYPQRLPTTLTFGYLYEMRKMVKRHTSAWDIDWFLPAQNRNQLTRLWNEYRTARIAAERGEAAGEGVGEEPAMVQAQPAQRRNGAPRRAPAPSDDTADWLDAGDSAF